MQQTEITTKDLGNGYYQHEMTVTTYYLHDSVVSPVSVVHSQLQTDNILEPKNNLGEYEPYRLTQFINKNDATRVRGQVVPLATIRDGKVAINQNALQLISQYRENDVSFVGNYGRANSGKSYWYDTILALSQEEGYPFSNNKGEPGLYMWTIPYARDNMRVFMLDNVDPTQGDELTHEQQMLLDLQLLLCEKMVIVPEPGDERLTYLKPAYQHLKQSQERFSSKGIQADKFSTYWPNQVYTLYRSPKPVKKDIDEIGTLFNSYNFTIIHDALLEPTEENKEILKKSRISDPESAKIFNQKYFRMSALVWEDILEKSQGKQHNDARYTGATVPRIVMESARTLNNQEKGGEIEVDRIFGGLRDDLYEHTIRDCMVAYNKQLEHIRKDPSPKPMNKLTEAFQRGNRAAFRKFDKEVVDPTAHPRYQVRLQSLIDKEQADILKQNHNKTVIHYHQVLPDNYENEPTFVSALKDTFARDKEERDLDQSDTIVVSDRLKKTTTGEGGNIMFVALSPKERERQLEKEKARKERELDKVILINTSRIRDGSDQDQKELIDQHSKLVNQSVVLKDQLNAGKDHGKEISPKQREIWLNLFRNKQNKNDEQISRIQNQNPEDPERAQLEEKVRRVQLKNSQMMQGLSSIARSFISQKSSRSLIRDIKSEKIKKPTK